jgi:hypothetical protein
LIREPTPVLSFSNESPFLQREDAELYRLNCLTAVL